MPWHYAISEACIVLVAALAAARFWPVGRWLPLIAIGGYGAAAAIGVVRFGAGLVDSLAPLHAGASQVLGLGSTVLLLAALRFRDLPLRKALAASGAALLFAAVIHAAAAGLLAPIYLAALVSGLALAGMQALRRQAGWHLAAGFAVLLVATLFVRRAPWLDPHAAFHGYHLLLALGLALLAIGFIRPHQSVAPESLA